MRFLFLSLFTCLLFACNNNSSTAASFCDTACRSDSFIFTGTSRFEPKVAIGVKNCQPDSLTLTHNYMGSSRTLPVSDLTNQDVRIHTSAISCEIIDTSHAWLSFNDCITGRGFLYKFPFNKQKNITKIKGALNSFDKKFVVDPDLRAYTDRGSIFVVNIRNDKEAVMTFKEVYDIDFNKLHDVVDSINVSKSRIYVKLKKAGQDVALEKNVSL